MQKYLNPIINCLLCSIGWYSFGGHSQFVSYLYMFASYSYSCKILQPYVAATVRKYSDAVLSSFGALLMKTVIKIIVNNKWSTFASAGSVAGYDTCESALTTRLPLQLPNRQKIFAIYALTLLMMLQLALTLTLRVQFCAYECNKGIDADP